MKGTEGTEETEKITHEDTEPTKVHEEESAGFEGGRSRGSPFL